MRKNAFITGINGQDGSYLAELLLQKGYTVSGLISDMGVIGSLTRIQHILPKLTLYQGNLTDQMSITNAIRQSQPDEVYNLASMSSISECDSQRELTISVNGSGVHRVIEAIASVSTSIRFFQASTCELFGQPTTHQQNESTVFHPCNVYGFGKLLGHQFTQLAREERGLFACSGIMFNHESPRRGERFVTRKITTFVAEVVHAIRHHGRYKGPKLSLGNLQGVRDWGYAPEYVDAMWRILQAPHPHDYVIATGNAHTVQDFLEQAFAVADIPNWRDYIDANCQSELRRPEAGPFRGDAQFIRQQLGWQATKTFDELVATMVEADVKARERLPIDGLFDVVP